MLLETRKLTRRYPGVVALDHVDFDLEPGEVHVLFGENGAGKSTLISMLAGANTASEGQILLDGKPVSFSTVAEAQEQGVYAVFQEFSLVPTLTVAQNIYLGDEKRRGLFLDRRAMREGAAELFRRLGFEIDPAARVASLSRAQQQMVEIAKAVRGEARVLILDEPTASLTDREVNRLFEFIEDRKAAGVGIIYISHRMQEFSRIANRVTVLRDGAKIGTVAMAQTGEEQLVEMMTGRKSEEIYPVIKHEPGEVILSVRGLRAPGVSGVDLDIRRGEVLSIAGLVGSGKSASFRALMGLNPRFGGEIRLNGTDVSRATPREMIRAGVYYLSPDRKHEGLDLAARTRENLSVNLAMSGGAVLNRARIRKDATDIAERVALPPGYREKAISQLSGGNQQKALFGKAFGQEADIFIFDEPTVGVDMGARTTLYRVIRDLAESGKAVVVISSDLPEAMNLAHRLLAFSQGRIVAEFPRGKINEDEVLAAFFEDSSRGVSA